MAVSNPKSNTLATYTLINNWKVVILDAGMQLIQTQLLTPSNKPFGNKTQPSTRNPKFEIALVIRNNEKLITSQIQTDTRFFGGIEAFNTIIKAANETDFSNLSPIESVIVIYQGPPQPVNPVKILYKISGTVIDTETELPLDKVKICINQDPMKIYGLKLLQMSKVIMSLKPKLKFHKKWEILTQYQLVK